MIFKKIKNIFNKFNRFCSCIIRCLNRIKKIDVHRNGTITTEKLLKLQEFWWVSWPPEDSGSREIFISSFRHPKFPEIFWCILEVNPKEQISTQIILSIFLAVLSGKKNCMKFSDLIFKISMYFWLFSTLKNANVF